MSVDFKAPSNVRHIPISEILNAEKVCLKMKKMLYLLLLTFLIYARFVINIIITN